MSSPPPTTSAVEELTTPAPVTAATSPPAPQVTAAPELSSTASPSISSEPATEPVQDAPATNPKIAQLKSMFPEITEDVLEAVLEAHGGDVAQASELLLSMNDPTPEQTSPSGDADEQFARALQQEEEEHARREQQQRAAARQSSGGTGAGAGAASMGSLQYQAYVPRRRAQSGGAGNAALSREGGGAQLGTPQKDELDQLTEQFSKIAEQGKKTFGTLFGMAKEQIGKLNESINAPGGSAPSGSAPAPPPKSASSAGWTPPSALPRPQPQAGRSSAPSVVPELLPRPSPAPAVSRDAPLPSTPSPASTVPPASSSTAPSAKPDAPAQPEQPKTDFTKIGLLPRQSVSLLDNKKKDGDSDSDEDDLEYTRNPFDRDD